MATLLHDAVMNPAEGNVPRPQGGTVGDRWRGRRSWGRTGAGFISLQEDFILYTLLGDLRKAREPWGSKRFLS